MGAAGLRQNDDERVEMGMCDFVCGFSLMPTTRTHTTDVDVDRYAGKTTVHNVSVCVFLGQSQHAHLRQAGRKAGSMLCGGFCAANTVERHTHKWL